MWFEVDLVQRAVITFDQLYSAIEQQQLERTPLGRLAIRLDYMTMAQTFEVLEVQATSARLFGEIALEMQFLTEDELARLLLIQTNSEKAIAEILVEQGAISREKLDEERRRFRQILSDDYATFDLDAATR
jgi:hypothetical protein